MQTRAKRTTRQDQLMSVLTTYYPDGLRRPDGGGSGYVTKRLAKALEASFPNHVHSAHIVTRGVRELEEDGLLDVERSDGAGKYIIAVAPRRIRPSVPEPVESTSAEVELATARGQIRFLTDSVTSLHRKLDLLLAELIDA